MNPMQRRTFLRWMLGAASALPVGLAGRRFARATPPANRVQRVIFFYFPDGIAGRSQSGEAGLWEATQSGTAVQLSEILQPLGARVSDVTFLNGLSMGTTDEGSHPGGAKKLLTAVDGGNGESIDQYLARMAGSDTPFRSLYLGVQATTNNASGDKFLSYPSPGITVAPEDDPLRAFRRVFSGATTTVAPDAGTPAMDPTRSILDVVSADLGDLRAALGDAEHVRLQSHLEALREVEAGLTVTVPAMMAGGACSNPSLAYMELSGQALSAPENFPALLRAQTDLMVQAMACGLTRVGVVQCSQHTSELIMSRFMGSEMYDPRFDMRSHQASHYGARQDRTNRLFTDYLKQRRWFVSQFAYLLEQLRARPEGSGTMLDHSLVVLCSEVSDGNTHSHQDMPFLLAGGAGAGLSPGRVVERRGQRHGDLWVTVARSMGLSLDRFGDAGGGGLQGVL